MSLENVKVGDKLVVRRQYNITHSQHYNTIQSIERITDTLVITKTHRFRKSTGIACDTDNYSCVSATVATPDDVKFIKKTEYRRRLINRCLDISFNGLSTQQLEQIIKITQNNDD